MTISPPSVIDRLSPVRFLSRISQGPASLCWFLWLLLGMLLSRVKCLHHAQQEAPRYIQQNHFAPVKRDAPLYNKNVEPLKLLYSAYNEINLRGLIHNKGSDSGDVRQTNNPMTSITVTHYTRVICCLERLLCDVKLGAKLLQTRISIGPSFCCRYTPWSICTKPFSGCSYISNKPYFYALTLYCRRSDRWVPPVVPRFSNWWEWRVEGKQNFIIKGVAGNMEFRFKSGFSQEQSPGRW